MVTVQEILAEKGTHILTVNGHASVLEAAVLMNEHKVGCLLVGGMDRLEGIVTERDVLMRVVAQRRDPASTKVQEVMTREVVCATPQMPLEEAQGLFMCRRIRHLPVVEPSGRVLGLISIGDLNAWQANEQEQKLHFLHEYIYGRT